VLRRNFRLSERGLRMVASSFVPIPNRENSADFQIGSGFATAAERNQMAHKVVL